MAKQSKGEFDAALPVLINDNVSAEITPERHRSVEQNMSDSVVWKEDPATLEAVVTFDDSVRYSVYSGSQDTLPNGYTYYLLDGEVSTLAMPTVNDGEVIIINNNTSGTTMTLNGDLRQNGSNITTTKLRPGTTRRFVGSSSRWVSI